MIHVFTFLLSQGGFALLLAAMPRHQRDWLGHKLPPMTVRVLRLFGFTALVLAFAMAVTGFCRGYGAVAWFGWLTISAALTVVVNANRERLQRLFGKAGR